MPSPTLRSPVGARAGRNASRFLFQWEAADGLDDLGRLVARTGQVGAFSCGGTVGARTYVDSAGRVALAGKQQPRFHHQYNPTTGLFESAGLLLEGYRTNLVIQSDALTAANGWTVPGGMTATANYSRLGSLGLTRITGSSGNGVYRSVTLTGDGAKACSSVVQFDVAGTTIHWLLYDGTAAAQRCQVTVTWASDGTATAVANAGTLVAFVPLGEKAYRILAVSTSCIAANAHDTRAVQGGSADSVRVGGIDVENAVVPMPSIIPTGASIVTRTEDAFNFPFLASPQASTWYGKAVEYGTVSTADGYYGVGSSTDAALFVMGSSGGAPLVMNRQGADAIKYATYAPSFGDVMEVFAYLAADGSVAIGQSINGAAAVVSDYSVANELAPTWFDTTLTVGSRGGATSYGALGFQSLRVAAGLQSLNYMRAG